MGISYICGKIDKALNLAIQALEDLVDPIGAIKRNMKPTEQLNGYMAIQISNDPNHLKTIATNALRAIKEI